MLDVDRVLANYVKGGGRASLYSNPEMDKLFDAERAELDPAKRLPILQQMTLWFTPTYRHVDRTTALDLRSQSEAEVLSVSDWSLDLSPNDADPVARSGRGEHSQTGLCSRAGGHGTSCASPGHPADIAADDGVVRPAKRNSATSPPRAAVKRRTSVRRGSRTASATAVSGASARGITARRGAGSRLSSRAGWYRAAGPPGPPYTGPMPVVHTLLHRAGDGFDDTITPDAISDLLAVAGNIVWVEIQAPTPGDLELLRSEFGFHELALEDIVAPHERAKIDPYDGYYFIVFNGLENHRACEIDLFVGKNYLVSVHHGPVMAIGETIDRWRRNAEQIGPGVGGLLYTLLDALVDGYFPVVDDLAERVEALEASIFEVRGEDHLADVFALKKELLDLRRALSPERDVLNVLLRRDVPLFGSEILVYFQDVYDHTIRVLDSVDLYRDQLSGLLDAHLSIVSNRLNETMKRMTALATILMTVALVSGIYGMNFRVMPELEWQHGYEYALGLMLALGIGLFVVFRRIGWL